MRILALVPAANYRGIRIHLSLARWRCTSPACRRHCKTFSGQNNKKREEFDVTQGTFNPPEAKSSEEISFYARSERARWPRYIKPDRGVGSCDTVASMAYGKKCFVFLHRELAMLRSIMLTHLYHHRGHCRCISTARHSGAGVCIGSKRRRGIPSLKCRLDRG